MIKIQALSRVKQANHYIILSNKHAAVGQIIFSETAIASSNEPSEWQRILSLMQTLLDTFAFFDVTSFALKNADIDKDVMHLLTQKFPHQTNEVIKHVYCLVQRASRQFGFKGIYMRASSIRHSCDPSAIYEVTPNQIILSAKKPIKIGDEITLAFSGIDVNESFQVRQADFFREYARICSCFRCLLFRHEYAPVNECNPFIDINY